MNCDQQSQERYSSQVLFSLSDIHNLRFSANAPVPQKNLVRDLHLFREIFAFEPSRLCRHPSIRTLCERFIARCQMGVLVSVGAAT